MNKVVQAQVKEFTAAYSASKASLADQFELYTILSVTNGLLSESIDPYKFHLKGKEFGLDGLGILVQGEPCLNCEDIEINLPSNGRGEFEFLFFQSKISEKFDYGDISKFLDAAYQFFESGLEGESEQIDELIAAKDKLYNSTLRKNPTLRCYFVATGQGEVSERIMQLVRERKAKFESLAIFESIEINLLGSKTLQDAYRSATNAVSESIEFPHAVTLPEHDSVDEAFVGYIDADQILKLVRSKTDLERINRAVFFDNIRDFAPESSINKSIENSLQNGDSTAFGYRNNGITIVAKEIKRTRNTYDLEEFQIVNGCQTSNVLFNCREQLEGVFVPLRLIGSKDPDFVSSIIIGTNKQNEVRDEQFLSLKPFMKNLEEFCRNQDMAIKLFIERRENQYRGVSIERTRLLKPREIMKSVAAMILRQPNRAARDYRKVLADFENEVFQDDHDVALYHSACFASYRYDFLIRNHRVERSTNVYKYFVLYYLGVQAYRFHLGKKEPKTLNLLDLKKGVQGKLAELINEAVLDEEGFIVKVNFVSSEIERIIESEWGGLSREKLRDTLRSDKFMNAFLGLLEDE